MNDFFANSPTADTFDAFWEKVPAKVNKQQARKAWQKMRPADRRAADDAVVDWFAWWRKSNPQASWIHPATYLNGRRWEDEGWQPQQASTVDRAAFWADSIKAGRYVSPATCNPALCREMIDRGLVTKREVLEKGLSI